MLIEKQPCRLWERDRIESDWKFFEDGKFRKKKKKTMRPKVNVIVSIKNNCVTVRLFEQIMEIES